MRIRVKGLAKGARRFNFRSGEGFAPIERKLSAVRFGENRPMHLYSVSYVVVRSLHRLPDLLESGLLASGRRREVRWLPGMYRCELV